MTENNKAFKNYYAAKIRETQSVWHTVFAVLIYLISRVILEFFAIEKCCDGLSPNFGEEFVDFYAQVTLIEANLKSLSAAWFLVIPLYAFFLAHLYKIPSYLVGGVYLQKTSDEPPRSGDFINYALIEWLPFHLAAIFILFSTQDYTLFGLGVLTTIVLCAQLIWSAAFIFKKNGKNCVEAVTELRLVATEDKLNKIKAAYEKDSRRLLGWFVTRSGRTGYIIITAFFIFCVVQIIRVPSLHPEYQKTLYGGYNIIWDNNMYYALQGIYAPEDVEDFVQYGRHQAYKKFKYFEEIKSLSGVNKAYRYDVPDLRFSVAVRPDSEIHIDDEGWKRVECFYDMILEERDDCASYDDLQGYVADNQILWDRFNRVPDMGDVYAVPPQFMGGQLYDLVSLVKLKASHIVYLAEEERAGEAMQEWLRFMKLYSAMAQTPETLVYKAVMGVVFGMHLRTLEKVLYVAPEQAAFYQDELIAALKSKDMLFRVTSLLFDDWGLIEPFTDAGIGNANAIKNDLFACMMKYKELAEIPHDQFPFGQKLDLCPELDDQSPFEQFFIYPMKKPGIYTANVVYSLLLGGVLKGQEIIESLKLYHVKMKMAELLVRALADGVTQEAMTDYINNAPQTLQNPITHKPFEWDEERQEIFFTRPYRDGDVQYGYQVNLKSTRN